MTNKNIKFIILIIIAICLIAVSITYAWYSMTKETNDINNAASGGKLEIIYQQGQDITGNLRPSKTNEGALSTTATIRKSSTSVDALANVTLNIEAISEELAISAFKWEVYKDIDSNLLNSGTFEGVTGGTKINLVENCMLLDTDTTFIIKLWLNGDESDGSIANKSISAFIDASAVNAPANID